MPSVLTERLLHMLRSPWQHGRPTQIGLGVPPQSEVFPGFHLSLYFIIYLSSHPFSKHCRVPWCSSNHMFTSKGVLHRRIKKQRVNVILGGKLLCWHTEKPPSLIAEWMPFALTHNCDGFYLSNMHVFFFSLIKYSFKCLVPEIVQ